MSPPRKENGMEVEGAMKAGDLEAPLLKLQR